jgi:hypothetical protein
MSRIVACPYCHNEFNFKHVGKLFTISYHKRRYIVKNVLNVKVCLNIVKVKFINLMIGIRIKPKLRS